MDPYRIGHPPRGTHQSKAQCINRQATKRDSKTCTQTWQRGQSDSNSRELSRPISDSTRPSTPVPSLIASDTISPLSNFTCSPASPTVRIRQGPNLPDARREFRPRPPALHLDKRDIGPPQPSPVNMIMDYDYAYTPHRAAPSTPLFEHPGTNRDPAAAEVSVMEWDDNQTSTLTRLIQSLKIHPVRRSTQSATSYEYRKRYPKSPESQENATPRPVPMTFPVRRGPVIASGADQQTTKTSHLSRPRHPLTAEQLPLSTTSSNSDSRQAFVYHNPDLTRPHRQSRQGQNECTSSQECHSSELHPHSRPSPLTQARPPSTDPCNHSRQKSRSPAQPSSPATSTWIPSTSIASHAHSHFPRLYGPRESGRQRSSLPANEATPFVSPVSATPSSAAKSSATTGTDWLAELPSPPRLKALVQGLVKRVSQRTLKRAQERGASSRAASPFKLGRR